MKRCPITYQRPSTPSQKYSKSGLATLSRRLENLQPLGIRLDESDPTLQNLRLNGCYGKLNLNRQAIERGTDADRFVLLWDKDESLQLAENMDLTAKLARAAQLDVQHHGMLWHNGGRLIYWFKRPDFKGRFGRLKYEVLHKGNPKKIKSIISAIDEACTFPALEKLKLFRLIFFSFITGNDALESQTLMLLTDKGKTQLAPIVSICNEDINGDFDPETFFLAGNRKNVGDSSKLLQLAEQELGINPKAVTQVLKEMESAYITWLKIINRCFLTGANKERYTDAINKRRKVFFKY